MFCYTGAMKSTWRHRDIIDLEYFLHQDKERTSRLEQQTLRERDRRIYRQIIRHGADEANGGDRRILLRRWLESRRQDEREGGNGFLPGQLAEEIYVRLCLSFSALGLLIGAGAGLSFFTYSGKAPLNVFHYLAAFVFLQLLILLILFVSVAVRSGRRLPTPSLLSSLVAGCLINLFQSAGRRLVSGITAEKRDGFTAILGIIKGKRIYSPLIFWPCLLVVQLFAASFNLGMLAVTLYKVAVTDIAFGWQSTIQFSAEAIEHFVRILALPWSWLVGGGIAYPSLAEIEGSRIILKDGIYHLATQNLISWWPFLCFALCTYGLLPRVVLLLVALHKKGRSLKSLRFDQAVFDRLVARMRTPVISTQAEPETAAAAAPCVPGHQTPAAGGPRTGLTVMVPDDIFDLCPDAELRRVLARDGAFPVQKIRFAEGYAADRHLLDGLVSQGTDKAPLLILMEAWMPPITDFMVFLHDLRRVLSPSAPIRIGLVGRPAEATVFTPVKPADFRIWQQKIDGLGDPYLSVEDMTR